MINTKSFHNLFILLVLMLVIGCFSASSALAAGLTPADEEYENGSIVLHKQAERIGADEWRVNVSATIDEIPTQPPQLEVVIVLDMSNSMLGCTHASHIPNVTYAHTVSHTHDSDCPLGESCKATYVTHNYKKYCTCAIPVLNPDGTPVFNDFGYPKTEDVTFPAPTVNFVPLIDDPVPDTLQLVKV